MKKLTLILIVALMSGILNSQSIIDTTKRWSTVIHELPSYIIFTEYIKFGGDTIIDLLSYKKVLRSTDEFQNVWESYGFIRETFDKKVYYRTDTTPEYLLYDFELNVNETIETTGIYGDVYNSHLTPMTFLVSQIDSVYLGNVYRKQLHLNPVIQGDTSTYASEFWIEGIGSKTGILHWEAYFVGGNSYQLLCHLKNDTIVYQNPSYTTCYYYYDWLDVKGNIFEDRINVYPNPANDNLFINTDENATVEIINMQGQIVATKTLSDKNSSIDVSELRCGVYTMRVKTDNGIAMKKMVKQ